MGCTSSAPAAAPKTLFPTATGNNVAKSTEEPNKTSGEHGADLDTVNPIELAGADTANQLAGGMRSTEPSAAEETQLETKTEQEFIPKDEQELVSKDEQELASKDEQELAPKNEQLEKTSAVKRLYAALDKNQDGKIVAVEYLAFLTDALGSTTTLEQAQKSMAFKDKDKDGTLSEAEVTASCEGVDAATINDWCEKLEAKVPKTSDAAQGSFSCCRPQVTKDEITVRK
jgi:hypothetical protein